MIPDGATRVFDRGAIGAAVDDIAAELERRYADENPILLCVLLGALPFLAALHSRLGCPHDIDTVQVSRYRDGVDAGELQWLQRPARAMTGRVVVIVDDVLDEGHTLAAIKAECRAAGARDVVTAVLVRKSAPTAPVMEADYVGLRAGPGYLVGFGMDYGGRYRDLPEIYELETETSDD